LEHWAHPQQRSLAVFIDPGKSLSICLLSQLRKDQRESTEMIESRHTQYSRAVRYCPRAYPKHYILDPTLIHPTLGLIGPLTQAKGNVTSSQALWRQPLSW
jgi:hypothetical protein